MEYATYIVDGQTLVDNVHIIKQWIYAGDIGVYIPLSSVEAVDTLYKKSQEPKETPKDDRQQKRMSGRARKEHPLFDINPWTAKEFLDRIKAGDGVAGAAIQQANGEDFTLWADEDEKAAKAREQPLAPPNSFSEALLRKLNIAQPQDNAEGGPNRPKLIPRAAHTKPSTFKYQKVPAVDRQQIPEAMRPFFSAALWRTYEFEGDPLAPEACAVLAQDQQLCQLAQTNSLPSIAVKALRARLEKAHADADLRASKGMVEEDFSDPPKHVVPLIQKPISVPAAQTNGHLHTFKEIEARLEATAMSAIEQLLGGIPMADRSAAPQPSADLRPSISYAMAAGATKLTTEKAAEPIVSAAQLPDDPVKETPDAPLPVPGTGKQTATTAEDEPSSDEEVVVFAGKKRRSQDASRILSRPTTATATSPTSKANSPKLASPKPAKAILESTLKPQSPIFTPGQLYTAGSPLQQSVQEAYSKPGSKSSSPIRGLSSPKRDTTATPNGRGKLQNVARSVRAGNSHARSSATEDAQRQSEIILQRQREAIKRSAQIQEEAQAARAQQDAKTPKREIEVVPTANPVVIDPDEFGRDYTIRSNANDNSNGRGKGSVRRGGRSRGGKTQPLAAEKKQTDMDFVLKSGAPRGSTRGKGKLWVP